MKETVFKNQHNEVFMSDTEFKGIVKYLNENDIMLEWGSGGSTYNFCNYVKEYYSIEHDIDWYNSVKNEILKRNIQNVKIFHVPSHDIKLDEYLDKESFNLLKLSKTTIVNDIVYAITRGGGLDWHCYINYINKISTFGIKFNKILIDGRARQFCAYKAINYLGNDGLLFIHDFKERKRYHTILNYFDVVEEFMDEGLPGSLIVLKKKLCYVF